MMRTIAAGVALILAMSLPARGDGFTMESATPPQCFLIQNFQTWKAPDARTIYIRVNLNQYYRLDLSATCSGLTWPMAHLVTHWNSTSQVCSAIDWDLKVAQDYPSSSQPCIVKTQTPLTPAQVAAIPPKFRP